MKWNLRHGIEQATVKMYCPFQVLSIFLLLATAATPGYSSTVDVCSSSFSCGNGVGTGMRISYPFWTSTPAVSSDQICGYRPLEVTCQGNIPSLLSRSGASFIVKAINQTAKTVQLVDHRIGNSTNGCPNAWRNITVEDDFPGLSYSPSTINLRVFLNCSSLDAFLPVPKENKVLNENKAECFRANGNSYIFVDGKQSLYIDTAIQRCRSWTTWPVMRDVITGRDVVSAFAEAMQGGFELQWSSSGDEGQCASCELRSGRCVYINRTGELTFQCRCVDDTGSFRDCFVEGKSISTRSRLAIGVPSSCLILGISGVALYIYAKLWKRRALEEIAMIGQTVETILEMNGPIAIKRYKYSEIKRMSNSFSVKLGKGGYGTVYKGKLRSGIPIAIKVLKASKANGEEFLNEVVTIGRTSHKNVVSLLGFCFQGTKRALIYEFMPNGSLEKFLFDRNVNLMMPLSWDKIYKIALGIAKGLEYLHGGCKTSIVHFDIKPHNILLDEELCPKISDFGLAKLFSHKQIILPAIYGRGTIGYIAPELIFGSFGNISNKSDIYSYGMLILEMVGKRRNFNMQVHNTSEVYFPQWVYDNFSQQKILQAYDIIPEAEDIAKKMIIVGLCCIQTNPTTRPSISRVVEMLEGNTVDLEMPPKPYLYSPTRTVHDSFNLSIS